MKARKKGSNDEWKDVAFVQLKDSDILYREEYMEFNVVNPVTLEVIKEDYIAVRTQAAIAAMQAIMIGDLHKYEDGSIMSEMTVAKEAVAYADALIDELNKGE